MTRTALAILAVIAALSGCASPAKDISFDPVTGTGVVAIPDNTDVWPTYHRSQALALIQSRVGPSFEIIEEQEVVVGQTTSKNRWINTEPGGPLSILPGERQLIADTTTTRDVTEYRIAYRRKPIGMPTSSPASSPITSTGQNPPGSVIQTQYPSGASNGAVQPAGGLVPSVAPGPVVQPAGASAPSARPTANCSDGKCLTR